MAHDAGLEGYSAPTEREAEDYYEGFAGSPRLVARTSTTVWRPAREYDERPWKARSVVGDHIIAERWSPVLRRDLIAALDVDTSIAWQTFYPVRIGSSYRGAAYHELQRRNHPVVLLVGVWPDQQRIWAAAMRAALRCRDVLREYGVSNVEVEIMELYVGPLTSTAPSPASPVPASPAVLPVPAAPAAGAAAPFPLEPFMDWSYSRVQSFMSRRNLDLASINSHVMPLLPFAGCRIEQEATSQPGQPTAAGTLGLFVSLKHEKDTTTAEPTSDVEQPVPEIVFGITSQHVAIGQRIADDKEIYSTEQDQPQFRVLSAGAEYLQSKWIDLRAAKFYLQEFARKTQMDVVRNPDNDDYSALHNMQNDCISYIGDLQEQLDQLQETDPAKRVVGTVAYAPSRCLDKNSNFRNWALVQLAAEKSNSFQNKVYMAEPATEKVIYEAALIDAIRSPEDGGARIQYDDPTDNLDANGFLQLHGHDLPAQPFFATETRTSSVLVAKRGQRSGLRFGVVNNIEAVSRTPFAEDDRSVVSLHLLVLDFERDSFSKRGDSGSCVFDLSGRVLGIIDAGARIKDIPGEAALQGELPSATASTGDVTYVTPIQWVLEGIRDFTGCEPHIL